MNLIEITYTKQVYYTKISENKTILFFYRRKQNQKPNAEIVEDPC